jgi:hypothetical protein
MESNKYNIFLAPLVLTPHSSVLSTIPDHETHKKTKQQDTESSSPTVDDEKQSNQTPTQSYIEEKSSSNETIPNLALENTAASEVDHHLIS